jgi:hypothetical protein
MERANLSLWRMQALDDVRTWLMTLPRWDVH